MTRVGLCLALLLAAPAGAQTALDRLAGLYGDLAPPEMSCTANPHQITITHDPLHAVFTYDHAFPSRIGTRTTLRYDILGYDDSSLTLRLEGETQRTESGQPVIWVLRLTDAPAGYCWGRTDWPLVACSQPAVRCDKDAPTS